MLLEATQIRLTYGIGIAHGAKVPFLSILAMNVRTEIAYGMFTDGCTALSWKTGTASFLAQNWDWQSQQAENLIRLYIRRSPRPSIDMITEAGIIGKIGLNSAGVGVCLNAIRAKGVDFNKLPVHLALRVCLDSTSKDEAIQKLTRCGIASSCHILVADNNGGTGLECSHVHVTWLPMSGDGILTHTNNFVKSHTVKENMDLKDSPRRLKRINQLVDELKGVLDEDTPEPELGDIATLLKDEEDYPTSICRAPTSTNTTSTLFSIIMDLGKRYAEVKLGRPTQNGGVVKLKPGYSQANGYAKYNGKPGESEKKRD